MKALNCSMGCLPKCTKFQTNTMLRSSHNQESHLELKTIVTLSDETVTHKWNLANAIDYLLGYIPMYALLSSTIGSAFKFVALYYLYHK